MGRIFLVDLVSEDPNDHYYVCHLCHTPIAFLKDFEELLTVPWQESVTSNVVNVQEEYERPASHLQVRQHEKNVYCVKCGDLLGIRWVETEFTENFDELDRVLYSFKMEKLIEWNRNGPIDNMQDGQLNVNNPIDNQQEGPN